MSDDELLQHYRSSRKATYLGELYGRYMPLVYGCCLKYLKSREAAQDAVMQVYEELVDKTLKHSITNFKSWLYTLAKNHCLMQLRSQGKHISVELVEGFMEIEDNFHLDSIVDDERRFDALSDCIEKLPKEQKVGIVKFFLENLSYKDISEATSTELNKVKSYIQNGKRNLKLCLEKKGVSTAL